MIFVEKTTRQMKSTNIEIVSGVTVTIEDVEVNDPATAVDDVLDTSAKILQLQYNIHWSFDEKSFKAVSRRWPDTEVMYISAKAL